jgi:hypothetical protein
MASAWELALMLFKPCKFCCAFEFKKTVYLPNNSINIADTSTLSTKSLE